MLKHPIIFPLLVNLLCHFTFGETKESFPFYESYLKDSDYKGFIDTANKFLEDNPEALEAPRLAYDLMMVGKVAGDVEIVKTATSLLLFNYTKSLPTLNYINSFEKGSKKLIELLKSKAEEGDLSKKDFAINYCRAILFIARSQGPEILKDKSLRLRIHLFAQKADLNDGLLASSKVLKEIEDDNSNFGKTVKILFSDDSNLTKIKELASISGQDAKFCTAFLLAQLSEKESKSEEIILFNISQLIFTKNPDSKKALELINSLGKDKSNSADIRILEAICHHFSDNTELAIQTLKQVSSSSKSEPDLKEMAESYADGLQFLDNRKSILADSIGKAFENLENETDAAYLKALFPSEQNSYIIHLGFNKKKQILEIQFYKNDTIQFAYRTTSTSSSILAKGSDQILEFATGGALPIPTVGITREIETGSFSYNFNLNFGSSFDQFQNEASKIMDNAYLSTAKGRSVLLSHILKKKVIWLGAAKTANGGTSFPIFSLSEQENKFSSSSITFDVKGNLSGLEVGSFKLSNLEFGSEEVFNNLPKWPAMPVNKKEKFDFSAFMSFLGEATKMIK